MRLALALVALSLLLPAAAAHHPCEIACAGGLWHEEGEGGCPGEARASYMVFGAESHDQGDVLVGAGWTCEDTGAGLHKRTGAFAYAPGVRLFFGIAEEPSRCAAYVGVIYTEHNSPNSPLCALV